MRFIPSAFRIPGFFLGFILSGGLCSAQPALAGGLPQLDMVRIATGDLSYRPAGEFLREGTSVSGPLVSVRFPAPILIMKHQVSNAQYALCVADGACQALDRPGADTLPATAVSFSDTVDFANWLSQKTGLKYRLPTDAEWAHAAREKFFGDPLGDGATQANPAANQVSRYEASASLRAPDPFVHEPGFFGTNSNGLADLSGNVWEWTSTCYQRAILDKSGSVIESAVENCGVRILEGQHRAYMTFFIRDAKGGGCSIGAAPDHLGFRLVLETGWLDKVRGWLASIGLVAQP